jgi:radical SAM-linked protein
LRITFAKKVLVKYISHLDLVLVWERALRRAQIPLAYSRGFNPGPRIQVASGLPVGTTGSAEIMDIIITHPLNPAAALAQLKPALPVGVAVHAVEEVPLKAPTLQNLLIQADYRVTVETTLPANQLTARIEALLAADKIIQSRQRKQRAEEVDLRPWLHDLRLDGVTSGEARLFMRLAAGQHGNLRPESVLDALELADAWAEVERTRLIFAEAGASP